MGEPFPFGRLTPRQREVIIRKAEGKTYGQVAYELGVTEQTVKNHLRTVYDKVGVSDRLELVLYAIHQHLELPSVQLDAADSQVTN